MLAVSLEWGGRLVRGGGGEGEEETGNRGYREPSSVE